MSAQLNAIVHDNTRAMMAGECKT